MSRPTIAPRRWTPPKPDRGVPARGRPGGNGLDRGQTAAGLPPMRVVELPSHGAEDVLVDDAGRVLTGTDDGRLLRVSSDGGVVELLGSTAGRPLGLEFAPDRSLIVCDARRGLLRVDLRADPPGVEVLVDQVDGVPMRFCNNAAVCSDGTIYFTDSSRDFGVDHWKAELLAHSRTGRLLRRRPSGEVEVAMDGLAFANGVALAADESFVAVAETGGYAVRRLWLAGDRAGEQDSLVENLPGFPDNISTGSDDLIWVSIASPRDPVLDLLLPLPPVLRKIVWALPEWMHPKPKRIVRVLAYDETGALVHDLHGQHDDFHMVTGVREHHGLVWVGSLHEPKIAVIGPLSPEA